MSDLLNESLDELTNEEQIEFNGLLNSSIKSVYALIEQLLEWSRVQTGRMEYKPEMIKLKSIYSNVTSVALISAQKKEITVNYEVDENLYVFADAMMIETVLRNLISNALKFTSNKGEINVTAKEIKHEVIIQVKDSGIGMTEKVTRKLFKIENHHTTLGTEGEKGTGLGLVLCKDLIEKNNGKIWVESELRVGSTFSFTLPLKEEK